MTSQSKGTALQNSPEIWLTLTLLRQQASREDREFPEMDHVSLKQSELLEGAPIISADSFVMDQSAGDRLLELPSYPERAADVTQDPSENLADDALFDQPWAVQHNQEIWGTAPSGMYEAFPPPRCPDHERIRRSLDIRPPVSSECCLRNRPPTAGRQEALSLSSTFER